MNKEDKTDAVRLIEPLAPHLAEELWEEIGGKFSVFDAGWPEFNDTLLAEDTITLVIQVNGKLRGQMDAQKSQSGEEIVSAAKELENVKRFIEGKVIIKEIYVPGKLVSFVVKEG